MKCYPTKPRSPRNHASGSLGLIDAATPESTIDSVAIAHRSATTDESRLAPIDDGAGEQHADLCRDARSRLANRNDYLYESLFAAGTGRKFTFYEFFAGGGMARLGLGNEWECRFANDIDEKKARSYRAYWQTPDVMRVQDVRELAPADLPGRPDLVWASFPCQDLSLAGAGAGLAGHRSGSFWPFWRLMTHLGEERRAPAVIVLENVSGALASHGGRDFAAIGDALVSAGYRFGAVIIDAVHFVPQSRPRLFIVAARRDVHIPSQLVRTIPDPAWHNQALVNAYRVLSPEAQCAWVWFNLPAPAPRRTDFADIIEDDPGGVSWNSREQTERLIAMMSETNRDKLRAAQAAGGRVVGGIYRRTRMDENGRKAQRAEVRFDGTAGCLRTATGGSSRQTVIIVDGSDVRSRLLSPREAARLMGLPEDYPLPSKYNEAYDLAGDGLVVPVVSYLEAHILRPILCEHAGAADVIGGGSAHA